MEQWWAVMAQHGISHPGRTALTPNRCLLDTTQPPKSATPPRDQTPATTDPLFGAAFETRTQEEADLAATMQSQGKGGQEIQAALDDLRAKKGSLVASGGSLPTPRDSVAGGVPTGKPEAAPRAHRIMQSALLRQDNAAHILARNGYRVERQPKVIESDRLKPSAAPDFRVGPNIFDAYCPTTANLENIRDTLSDKAGDGQEAGNGQAYRIVLNLQGSSATPDDIIALLKRKPVEHLQELLIIDHNGNIIHPDLS